MKDELVGKIMRDVAALRQKAYSYLTDGNDGNKKAKSIKKINYKHCLEATQIENKINQPEKIKLM